MGRGIAAVVPIVFGKGRHHYPEYFSSTFFEKYDKHDDEEIYTLKTDFLIENYKPFLDEFYDLIGETDRLTKRELPNVTTFEAFEESFDHRERNGWSPFLYEGHGFFSFSGGESSYFWHFYSGSNKAMLEVYSTLNHFERVLQKTMTNPLADVIKFGLFG